MRREEAEARAAELKRDAADDGTTYHVVRQDGDVWKVINIRVPGDLRRGELVETVEVAEKPPYPDDPRDLHTKHRPGY